MTILLAIVGGLVVLVVGADRFVVGASAVARNLGASPLVIGLTVVAVGTSAPEILISITAALQDSPGLAVGNALGSNIANIGLVLGTAALIRPIEVASRTLRRECPLLLLTTALAWLLLADGRLGRGDGVVLVATAAVLLGTLVWMGRRGRRTDPLSLEYAEEIPSRMRMWVAIAWLILGLAALLAGSRSVVWGATEIARLLGVSDLIIGLTIVAIGTSLPELAASVMSVLKDEPDLALGNVIGSNMFNLLPVLAGPALLSPHAVDPAVSARDAPVTMGLTVVLVLMAYGPRRPGRVNRVEGALLLACFAAYQSLLYLSANAG